MSSWSFAELFARRAREHAARTCIVARGRALTYAQVEAQASALAASLAELGVGVGDRIAINLPNWPEWVVAFVAAAKLGAVVVPVNPGLAYHELKYQLRHAEVSCAVTVERWEDQDYLETFEDLLAELPDLQYLVTVGKEDLWYDDRIFQFEDLVSGGDGRPAPAGVAVTDDADLALLYTSGTTGKPKGIRLSHRALVETALRTGEAMEMDPADRVLVSVPLFAVFGVSVMLGTIAAGATLVLQEHFRAAEALSLLEREHVTILLGVPTMFQLLLREPGFDPARLARLRTGVIAGGPVPAALLRRVRAWCDVQVAYGLTETGPTVAITRFGDPEEKRLTTVGRPLPGTEVRIVDPGTRAMLPAGAEGEITVRGPGVMTGYVRMPGETARSFSPEGFLLTGDLGVLEADGYLRVVGREKDTIVRGGFQVWPREIEDQLRAHPAVDDVCVIGIPDEVLGERICACVVPVEGAAVTAEELRDFARDTMADHKIPDLVRFFDAFPMTGTGKPKRRDLEQMVTLETTNGITS
jgi:fatty-acyl-CoA synthase